MISRKAKALAVSATAALLFSGCSVPDDGPLSGPTVTSEKCQGSVPPEQRVIYTTNLELSDGIPEAKLLKVDFTEPKNIEMMASSIIPRTDVIPVGLGYPTDADRDWPEWKTRVPAESGIVKTPVTLLVIEARRIDPTAEDATASGLNIEYESGGKKYRASSNLAIRISADAC